MTELGQEAALVSLQGAPVGLLLLRQNLSTFELLDSYLDTPNRPVLGVQFEQSPHKRWRQAQRLPQWFSNLLPEEKLREIVSAGLGLKQHSEYRLLVALGRDLPGALTIEPVAPNAREQLRLDIKESRDSVQARAPIRFSVAGVQLKLSMLWADKTLILAGSGALGDHYVKFPALSYPSVPENEFSMMTWASDAGINTPAFELRLGKELGILPEPFERFRSSLLYVVRRFDRQEKGGRIHIEDFNQVLGQWPERKYDNVNHEGLGRLIAEICGESDFYEYVRRLTFIVGSGNEDAHLKNWSIVYPDGIEPRLSPAYDMVSTIQYDDLTRGLALKFGGARQFHKIEFEQFEELAKRAGMGAARTVQTVKDTAARMIDSLESLPDRTPVNSAFMARLRKHLFSVPIFRP